MKKKTRIILFIAMLACVIASNWFISSSSLGLPKLIQYGDGSGMLDFKYFYTQEEAANSLLSLGQEGANVYTRILLIDFVFLISLAYVLGEFIRMVIRWLKLPQKYNRLSWLAYVRSGFDAIENILILIVLALLPAGQGLLGFAGVVTSLKFISLAVYLVAFIFLVLIRLFKGAERD